MKREHNMFDIYRVDLDWAEDVEQLGTKRKFWFRQPDQGRRRCLFKADDRVAGGTDKIGTGEDWAEKIACELCTLLGVPHVHYELAVEIKSGIPGVICENVAHPPLTLVLGNTLLLERDPSYPGSETIKYGVRQHTVESVAAAVQRTAPPPDQFCGNLPPGVESASDIFVGYVMLDALVANQDRHHENWGVLRGKRSMLAPTFDHGAALARNEPDEKRHGRLYSRDRGYSVERFAEKAKSSFYSGVDARRPLRTLAAFLEFSRFNSTASNAWLARLRQLTETDVTEIIERIPSERMSGVAREFTKKLILANQARLLTS